MTRTDRVKAAANEEIERYRSQIENNPKLRSVSLIVIFPRKRTEQIKVISRTEAESEFAHTA